MTAFHEMGAAFFEKTSLFDATLTSSLMQDLRPIAATILGIFLIWRVSQVMLGSNRKPIVDVSIEVIIWAIIWGFAFNSTYLNMVTTGMNEVYKWAGGGIQFFDNLDQWWDKLFKIADNLYDKDDSLIFPGRGVFALGIVILAAIIITGVPFLVIILTSIFLQILVLVAPFMLLSLIYPTLQKMFFNWVEQFLFVVLTVLIISLIQNALVSKVTQALNVFLSKSTTAPTGHIVADATIILMTCLLYAAIMALAVPLAKAISGSYRSIGFGQGV